MSATPYRTKSISEDPCMNLHGSPNSQTHSHGAKSRKSTTTDMDNQQTRNVNNLNQGLLSTDAMDDSALNTHSNRPIKINATKQVKQQMQQYIQEKGMSETIAISKLPQNRYKKYRLVRDGASFLITGGTIVTITVLHAKIKFSQFFKASVKFVKFVGKIGPIATGVMALGCSIISLIIDALVVYFKCKNKKYDSSNERLNRRKAAEETKKIAAMMLGFTAQTVVMTALVAGVVALVAGILTSLISCFFQVLFVIFLLIVALSMCECRYVAIIL